MASIPANTDGRYSRRCVSIMLSLARPAITRRLLAERSGCVPTKRNAGLGIVVSCFLYFLLLWVEQFRTTDAQSVLVQREPENECRCVKHSGHRTVRLKKAWGNALNDRGVQGWERKISSAPIDPLWGDRSSHTRPAIPGEVDASRARFRFAGCLNHRL